MWRITTPLPGPPRSVHAYLAALEPGRFLLVDGGMGTAEAWEALDQGVCALAGGWERVALQVLTHMHMDHVGLAARVVEASGARVLTGRLDAERMAHAAAHPDDEAEYRVALLRRCGAPAEWIGQVESGRARVQALAPPVRIDAMLEGDTGELPHAPGWHFVWTPGHTAGHVSLHRPADAVLIAGDAVLPRITPTLGVNRQREDPVGDYLEALDRIDRLRPRLLLPGHGDPLADGGARVAELRRAALEETATVVALLGEAPLTAWQVVEHRYAGRDLPPATRLLALRETLAHLERAVRAGQAAPAQAPAPGEPDHFRRA